MKVMIPTLKSETLKPEINYLTEIYMQLSYNLINDQTLKKAANTFLLVVFNPFQTTQSYFQRIY